MNFIRSKQIIETIFCTRTKDSKGPRDLRDPRDPRDSRDSRELGLVRLGVRFGYIRLS
jgi:hypothetical protein